MRKCTSTQNRVFSFFFFFIALLREKNIVLNFISLVCTSFRMQKSSFFPCRTIESTMQRINQTNFSHLLDRSFHSTAVILQCYMLDIFVNAKVQVDARTFFFFFLLLSLRMLHSRYLVFSRKEENWKPKQNAVQ